MAGERIIVVDDEPHLRELVEDYLLEHGYKVRTAGCGTTLRAALAEEPADLVLLDVNLPGESGFAIARALHAENGPPIIMLTASGDVVDRVVGLEVGADDYVTKPFDFRELRARMEAVLRRHRKAAASAVTAPAAATPGPAAGGRSVRFGVARLDLDARRLLRDDGEEVKLTAMEFDLLHAFATHPNRVLTRDQLLDMAHNKEWEPFDRSIDIRIARIRRKIEPDPEHPQVIKTVRGAGYIYVPGG